MGPGTGVADTGAMVCCAEAPSVPAAAKMAATQTLRMRIVVMTFPPCALFPEIPVSFFCRCNVFRSPSSTPSRSARNDADAARERPRHRELPIHDLEGKRRQGTRGRTVDHCGALARVIMRIVARAFEDLLIRHPAIHLTSGVRTNRGISNHACGRAVLGRADKRRRIQAQQ